MKKKSGGKGSKSRRKKPETAKAAAFEESQSGTRVVAGSHKGGTSPLGAQDKKSLEECHEMAILAQQLQALGKAYFAELDALFEETEEADHDDE